MYKPLTSHFQPLILVVLLLLVSCSGDNPDPVGPASPDRIVLEHDITLQGSTAYQLTVDANCSWTLTTTDTWFSVTPSSGVGQTNVTIQPNDNTDTNSRTGHLTLTTADGISTQITIFQSPGTVVYELNANSFVFDKDGETKPLIITCNTNWELKGVDEIDWLTANVVEGQAGTTTVNLTAQRNDRRDARDATLKLVCFGTEEETYNIPVQLQGRTPVLNLAGPTNISCTDSSPTFSILSNYNWQGQLTTSTGGTWARFANGSQLMTGVASAEVMPLVVTCDPNTTTSERSFTLMIMAGENEAQQSLTVTQAAGTLPEVGALSIANVKGDEATIQFSVSSSTFPVTSCGVELSVSENMQSTTAHAVQGTAFSGSVTLTLTGLTSGQTYYVRPYAKNAVGRVQGNVVTFATLSIPGPDDNPRPQ